MGVNTLAHETRPNAEKSAKLPYRQAVVAIPPATLALAMDRARAAVETMPGHLPGAPIIRQPIDIEEAYWAHVWRRLGRPDPGLTEGVTNL